MRSKDDAQLINALLALMQAARADFTLTFRHLSGAPPQGTPRWAAAHEAPLRALFQDQPALDAWLLRWRARLDADPVSPGDRYTAMQQVNPAFIARNHLVEAALNAASDRADLAPLRTLLAAVQHPFDDHPENAALLLPPLDSERVLQTFCGT